MYFCRLLSIFFLILFSCISWSLDKFQPVLSDYGADAFGRLSGNAFKSGLLELSEPGTIHAVSPEHSYPLSLEIAGVSVQGKQEIFTPGTQVLSFDLSPLQTVGDISVSSLAGFQQLIFQLSRKSKTAIMRFDPSLQMAEIQTNQLLIETHLPEGNHSKRIFPELLTAQATNQLLQAVECSLNTVVMVGQSVSCGNGTLERKGDQHLYFDTSQHAVSPIPQWQVQTNSNRFVELTNGTSRLILTVDNGVIVKGDVVPLGEPSDMASENNSNEKSKNRKEKVRTSSNSSQGSNGSTPSNSNESSSNDSGNSGSGSGESGSNGESSSGIGSSSGGSDDDDDDDKHRRRLRESEKLHGLFFTEDDDSEEEEEAEGGNEWEENGFYYDENRLLRKIEKNNKRKRVPYHLRLGRGESKALREIEKNNSRKRVPYHLRLRKGEKKVLWEKKKEESEYNRHKKQETKDRKQELEIKAGTRINFNSP